MERVKVSKTERLLNLISFMLRSPRPIPFSQIAGHVVGYDDEARLDSIEKRFDRDKAELRNMGIPVEYVDTGSQETSGYVVPRDKFFLRNIQFDTMDAILLALAARWGSFALRGSPVMREAFNSALRKLSIDTPEVEGIPAEPAHFLQVGRGYENAGENLQVICAAVFGRRTIKFKYHGRKDEQAVERRVDPYGLGISEGEWYLVGRDHARDDMRMFKIARMSGTANLTGASDAGPEFDIPKDFRIEDQLNRRAWDFGTEDPVEVRLEAPRDLVAQLRHEATLSFEIEDGDDLLPPEEMGQAERMILRFIVRRPERMVDWVLSLGPDVELLEPKEMRDQLKQRLSDYGQVYGGGKR